MIISSLTLHRSVPRIILFRIASSGCDAFHSRATPRRRHNRSHE